LHKRQPQKTDDLCAVRIDFLLELEEGDESEPHK